MRRVGECDWSPSKARPQRGLNPDITLIIPEKDQAERVGSESKSAHNKTLVCTQREEEKICLNTS